MKLPSSERIERTNYEGSWDDACPHCGEKQRSHMVTHGPFHGVLYEHRMPCAPEKEMMIAERRRIVRTARWLVTGINLVSYGVSYIPFLKETRLARKIVRRHLGHKFSKKKANKTVDPTPGTAPRNPGGSSED